MTERTHKDQIEHAVLMRVRREHNRIIDVVSRRFGLDRDEVAKTVTGRKSPGVLLEAKT